MLAKLLITFGIIAAVFLFGAWSRGRAQGKAPRQARRRLTKPKTDADNVNLERCPDCGVYRRPGQDCFCKPPSDREPSDR